jgi:hypothetical protein
VLEIRDVPAKQLYPDGGLPAHGEHIDVAQHIRRFPPGGAVLTTGANSTHVLGRSINVGPHDIAPNPLAHEFGHILGFVDRYFRGYRDRGPEGFEVLEVVIDPEDIMSAPGAGRVGRHHFERLLSARPETSREDVTMKAGVDALYTRRDPEEAAAQFRKLLEWNPNHYGATFQLARALDQGGKRGEARPWWEKALKMAEASHDKVTAAAARGRLAEQP